MSIIATLWARFVDRRNARAPRPPPPPRVADDLPAGCGWFESSHELQRGLSVFEPCDEPA